MATAARQFCKSFLEKNIYVHTDTYYSIGVPVSSAQSIHRRNVDTCVVYKPVLGGNQARTLTTSGKRGHTSVTIIAIIGPRNTV